MRFNININKRFNNQRVEVSPDNNIANYFSLDKKNQNLSNNNKISSN